MARRINAARRMLRIMAEPRFSAASLGARAVWLQLSFIADDVPWLRKPHSMSPDDAALAGLLMTEPNNLRPITEELVQCGVLERLSGGYRLKGF